MLLCQRESWIRVDALKSSVVWAAQVTRASVQLLRLVPFGRLSQALLGYPPWAPIPRTGGHQPQKLDRCSTFKPASACSRRRSSSSSSFRSRASAATGVLYFTYSFCREECPEARFCRCGSFSSLRTLLVALGFAQFCLTTSVCTCGRTVSWCVSLCCPLCWSPASWFLRFFSCQSFGAVRSLQRARTRSLIPQPGSDVAVVVGRTAWLLDLGYPSAHVSHCEDAARICNIATSL